MVKVKGIRSINKIAKKLGLDKKNLNIYKIGDDDKISLINGDVKHCEVEFLSDKKDNLKVVLSNKFFYFLIQNLSNLKQENSALKLEKSIAKFMPIDFGDVWSVAVEDIIKHGYQDINYDKLIEQIKEKHPNLFIDFSNFLPLGEKID